VALERVDERRRHGCEVTAARGCAVTGEKGIGCRRGLWESSRRRSLATGTVIRRPAALNSSGPPAVNARAISISRSAACWRGSRSCSSCLKSLKCPASSLGDRVAIIAYPGRSDAFDRAVAEFAVAYSNQRLWGEGSDARPIIGEPGEGLGGRAAVGAGRSTPRPGEPATWGRAPHFIDAWEGGEGL
jgi:hypothetical protein